MTFREKQKNYTRVREAYCNKEKCVLKTLAEHSISRDSLQIYLQAFKNEKKNRSVGKKQVRFRIHHD